jgi:3-oxoacyl-[acyl-carrier protein] reductase
MNIVISGTASGIGRAIALKFIKEGHRVFGFDIKKSSIDDPSYEHYLCDVREEEFPEVPEPDIVINNAGTFEEKDAIDVNLKGTINFNEHFIKSTTLRSVLFIASASARNGAEFPQYAASKAGMVGYMKNKALELSHKGVTVNSISPGGVITESNAHILESEELYSAVKAETLLGKWADPEEIADLAYFLTVVNRSMIGEDLLIDNGEMLRSNFIW